MAHAVDENGELINLSNYSRIELRKLKHNKYFCLKCERRLIMKVGERKRPHFSHFTSVVEKKESKESKHHKLAIHLLENSFNKQGFNTKTEYFISSIKQRPDVAVFAGVKSYAFEFQASNISLTLFRNRTLNLKKASFEPIWFLSSRLLQMKTNSILRLTPFLTQFIHRFSGKHPPQLFFLNPDKQQIIILEHILLFSEKIAYVQKRIIDLKQFKLSQLKNYSRFNFKLMLSLWKKEKFNFRTKVRTRSYGAEYHWRLWLYNQQIHFETLPSIIYLPTRDNYYFKVPPWNWQSRIILQIIHPLDIGGIFKYTDCLKKIKTYLIPQTHYPLIEYQADPLINYLKLLTHLEIIKPLPNNTYVKLKNLPFNQDINKSIIADDDILKQLLYNLK